MAFVSERKALKLFVKDKVDVISSWDASIYWTKGKMKMPSIVRLKYYVRWIPGRARFNRLALFKRVQNRCHYCGNYFKTADLTVDHIIPSSKGGRTNWKNCISACYKCNGKKGDRTPEEADMRLIAEPVIPKMRLVSEYWQVSKHHPDWEMYIKY